MMLRVKNSTVHSISVGVICPLRQINTTRGLVKDISCLGVEHIQPHR